MKKEGRLISLEIVEPGDRMYFITLRIKSCTSHKIELEPVYPGNVPICIEQAGKTELHSDALVGPPIVTVTEKRINVRGEDRSSVYEAFFYDTSKSILLIIIKYIK